MKNSDDTIGNGTSDLPVCSVDFTNRMYMILQSNTTCY